MYAPGTRRHIQAALKLGATMEEIMEVLKICVSQGMQASNLGVPILAEELEASRKRREAGLASLKRPAWTNLRKALARLHGPARSPLSQSPVAAEFSAS
jgi:hypothetical protein